MIRRVTIRKFLLGREAGAVLYVESETDERILGEWAHLLDHPAQGFLKRSFVRLLGG